MRRLKAQVYGVLTADDFEDRLGELMREPGRRVVNPLFGFLLNTDTLVRWRAVVAMGAVVSHLADQDLESARVVVRRMMWQLNDESGGIGWGCPESMGECIARHPVLARKYHRILISYLDPEGNHLEHPMLQRGLLWGIGRAAHARPGHMTGWARLLAPHLADDDPHHRGLAAWCAAAAGDPRLHRRVAPLLADAGRFSFFDGRHVADVPVKQMAAMAAERLSS
jgi:hypothetical protein